MTANEAAALATIEEEHRAFWMKDEASFEQCHVHSSDTLRWGYWQAGGFILRRGWAEIGPRSIAHMRRLPQPMHEFARAPITNLVLRAGSDMAWASYDRGYPYLPNSVGLGPNGTTHQLRVLERHGGRWLIAVTGVLDEHLGDERAVRVGPDGSVLWMSAPARQQLGDDEHLFIRTGCIAARERRTHARLKAAIAWAATLDSELMPRRGHVPVFMESIATGRLRVIWIVADVAGALVLLDDPRPPAQRVHLAAQAFGLSPGQTRLAETLVSGKTLREYTSEAGVSMNTARTHLKRIFEKVGVSSQSGLMRALLALTPPR